MRKTVNYSEKYIVEIQSEGIVIQHYFQNEYGKIENAIVAVIDPMCLKKGWVNMSNRGKKAYFRKLSKQIANIENAEVSSEVY